MDSGKPGDENGMILVNARKVEVFKCFYALFTVLMDTEPEATLIGKLRILREQLRGAVSDADMN